MIIDVDSLKKDLVDYFGTAVALNNCAMAMLIHLYNASDEEIVNIALKNGFNLSDYEINNNHKSR